MSDRTWPNGPLGILGGAVEGGAPGQGTAFLDGARADGSGNHGLLATLTGLTSVRASDTGSLSCQSGRQALHN